MWDCTESGWWTQTPVQEAGHHVTSPHRMWGGTGDRGMDPHTDSADTKNWPDTRTHGMARFQLWPRQRHQAILWILTNMDFYLVLQRRILSVMAILTSCVGRDGRHIRNSWGTIWTCCKQAAPEPRISQRPPPQFSPTVPFPPFVFHLPSFPS